MRTPDVSDTSTTTSLRTEEKLEIKRLDDELNRAAAVIASLPLVPAKRINFPQDTKQRNYEIEMSLDTDRDPPVGQSPVRLEPISPNLKRRYGDLLSSDCAFSPNLLQRGMPLSPERGSYRSPSPINQSPNRTVLEHKSDSPNLEEAKRSGSKKVSRAFRRCVIS